MENTRGARKLREWLADRGHNQQWLAEKLTEERQERVYQSSVSAWLRGAQMPLWGALAVQRVAGIPPVDWTVADDHPSSAKMHKARHAKAG